MGVRSVLDTIPDHQFGFRHHHGTPEQAHRVVQHILDAFENIFSTLKSFRPRIPTSHFYTRYS